MRVVLLVGSGSRKGSKKLLTGGQKLKVGRTEHSDWVFSDDDKMSRRHFEVWTDDVGAYLKDLGSTHGTKVNGKIVVETALNPEDEIVAGRTRFVVQIQGGDSTKASVVISDSPTYTDEPTVAYALRGQLKVAVTMEPAAAGWKMFRGAIDGLKPGTLCQLLTAKGGALYLIIDFRRLGQERPPELPGEYLFNWLPKEVSAAMSPWILPADAWDLKVWKPFVNENWGNDGLIALLSEKPPDETLAHVRSVCRVKGHGTGEGISGLCWPAILAPSLMSSESDPVRKLTSGLDGIVVELPDQPDTWQLFGPETLAETLKGFGMKFPEKPPEPAETTEKG